MSPQSLFQLAPGDLRWRIWNDAVVVFHQPSGDTHYLAPLPSLLFRRLLTQGPASPAMLAAAVNPLPTPDKDGRDREFETAADTALQGMEKLSIVERIES